MSQHIQQSQPCSIWQAVRHYIGRLGSWWNACSILVSTARRDPKIFSNAQLKAVRNRKSATLSQFPEGIDHSGIELEPGFQQEDYEQLPLMHMILTQHWGDNAMAEFTCRLQRRQAETNVHAELQVLNYFYQHNLKFADNVCYIGCSKLSCYCCHIYMKKHPLNVLSRPCHGNTWTRWAMPSLRSTSSIRYIDQDAKLLAEMVCQTQHEIDTCSFTASQIRQLESTTGMEQDFSDIET